MCKLKILVLICLAVVLTISVGQGQVDEVVKISFADAVTIGLANNIDVQKSKNELEALDMNKTQSVLAFMPSVSADVTAARQEGQQFQLVEDGFEISNVQANRLSGGLGANISLFEGFRKLNQYKIAHINLEAQQKGIERSKQQLVFDIAQQYLQILLDKELLAIADSNISNQTDQLRQIDGFVQAGIRPLADLFTQKATVKQLEMDYISSENTFLLDKAALARLLQLDPLTTFEVVKLADESSALNENLVLSELFETALQYRPDLKQFNLQTASAKRTIGSERAGIYPSLFAFYNYGTQYSSLNDLSFRNQLLDLYPNNTVGLNLSIPIFSNFTNKSRVVRAEVNYENTVLDEQDLKRGIFQDVQTAYLNQMAAIKRLEVSRVSITAAEAAFNIQQQRYNEGLANLAELAIANQNYITGASELEQAKFNALFQQIIVEFQVGTLDVTDF